ncbi:hypothetical protein [Kutzneria kofuensis]|uniref:PH (Pleckstrin Homology) domain-containing protein n=1 Tax=Kutzneria kofuensis TaxID=103725 RepID=A0A7W9KM16_9PSEU|nr:hypothetical protein [Kutzneria kofuensis]MBB5895036.1 hypothetical protein [Kutzneria kofuensis]
MIRCLLAWLFRRYSPGFGYGRGFRPIVWVLVVLTIVEGCVVELVLAFILPGTLWPVLLLALHVYALLWVLGLLASLTTRPHVLGPDTLVLRDSVFTELTIPLAAITSFSPVARPGLLRSGLKIDGDTALFAYGDANLAVHISPVDDPRLAGVRHLHITVDDRDRFLAAASDRLAGQVS